MDFLKASYRKMLKIRLVEQKILFLYSQNKISGTTHTYIGQEAIAVAAMNHICEGDFVFSNHRCHGHYIAYGGPIEKLYAEIMSKETGLAKAEEEANIFTIENFIPTAFREVLFLMH